MKKQQLMQQLDPQVIHRKNINRLIDQNRQLYSQIFRLQNKVNIVLTKNLTHQFKQKVQQEKINSKHKSQTQTQISQIKKLKKKILYIKNANKPQQLQDMRQAVDQLTFLKKQKQKYTYQKEALLKKRKIKDQGLQLNKPLQQQKKNMLSLYKAAQRQNFDIKNKSLKIQKQINNLHKIKQLAKTSAPKPTQNSQFQIKKIDHQISKLRNQIKQIQKQWQPRIDSLNTQYFLLKQIKQEKDKQINELQKILTTSKNRVLAMKQESKILQDKARVSQIIISPEKRSQINRIYSTQKEKHQFFQQFRTRPREQPIKLPTFQQKKKRSRSKSPKIQHVKPLFQTQPLKLFESPSKTIKNKQSEQIFANPKNLIYNQFSPIKQNILQQSQIKKPTKNFNSVAVGTTFYYNEQEQNQK